MTPRPDWERVSHLFQQALELIPSPHAEYWVAASFDKLDRTNDAIAGYERFLANPGARLSRP